jgi:hypothetical protein
MRVKHAGETLPPRGREPGHAGLSGSIARLGSHLTRADFSSALIDTALAGVVPLRFRDDSSPKMSYCSFECNGYYPSQTAPRESSLVCAIVS